MQVQEASIITGKLMTSTMGPGSTEPKKLYVKIFLGSFTMRPPRLKQAKVLRGELLIKYSAREWPENKNGPLYGDQGLVDGVGQLLAEYGYKNVTDLKYASEKDSRPIKDTLTLVVGPTLAKEFVDRGAVFVEESLDPMASRVIHAEPNLDVVLPPVVSEPVETKKVAEEVTEKKAKPILPSDLLDLSALTEATPKKVVDVLKTKPKVKVVKSKTKKVDTNV